MNRTVLGTGETCARRTLQGSAVTPSKRVILTIAADRATVKHGPAQLALAALRFLAFACCLSRKMERAGLHRSSKGFTNDNTDTPRLSHPLLERKNVRGSRFGPASSYNHLTDKIRTPARRHPHMGLFCCEAGAAQRPFHWHKARVPHTQTSIASSASCLMGPAGPAGASEGKD